MTTMNDLPANYEASHLQIAVLEKMNHDIGLEGFNLLTIPTNIVQKFTAYISDTFSFLKSKTAMGFIPTVTLNMDKSKTIPTVNEIFQTYNYALLKDLYFTTPVGLSTDYLSYVSYMQQSLNDIKSIFDNNLPMVNAIIGDCLTKPDRYSGTSLIEKLPLYDKNKFDKGYRECLGKGQNRKLKWSQLNKSNKEYIASLERFDELSQNPLVKDYTDTVKQIRNLQDKVEKLLNELKSNTSVIRLSPKNITILADNILTLARATDSFGMLTIIINDYTFIIENNVAQLKGIASN